MSEVPRPQDPILVAMISGAKSPVSGTLIEAAAVTDGWLDPKKVQAIIHNRAASIGEYTRVLLEVVMQEADGLTIAGVLERDNDRYRLASEARKHLPAFEDARNTSR
ncbi:MAG: hypothetical protein HYT83_00920 [Candidatus Levybacteria bacterium]|nr:hypothetical protein [Candidatus Levybacteria bacterium]